MQDDIESDSDYLGSPSIAQPPEHPQPARPGGIPSWQQEPLRLIDDAMTRWSGTIKLEQEYEGVKNRLRYLEKYQPRLKGELRSRCDTAIRLLKDRVEEFLSQNLYFLITEKVSKFVQKAIEGEVELTKARGYIASLQLKRPKGGQMARAVDNIVAKLNTRIEEYQK